MAATRSKVGWRFSSELDALTYQDPTLLLSRLRQATLCWLCRQWPSPNTLDTWRWRSFWRFIKIMFRRWGLQTAVKLNHGRECQSSLTTVLRRQVCDEWENISIYVSCLPSGSWNCWRFTSWKGGTGPGEIWDNRGEWSEALHIASGAWMPSRP